MFTKLFLSMVRSGQTLGRSATPMSTKLFLSMVLVCAGAGVAVAANPYLNAPADKPVSAQFAGKALTIKDGAVQAESPISARAVTTRVASMPWGAIFKISFDHVESQASAPPAIEPLFFLASDREILELTQLDMEDAIKRIVAMKKQPEHERGDVRALSDGALKFTDDRWTIETVTKGDTCVYERRIGSSGRFTRMVWKRGAGLVEYAEDYRPVKDGFELKRSEAPARVAEKAAKSARDWKVGSLREQLAAADEAKDWPAVAELAWRIIETSPPDADIWEMRAQALLATKDWERCAAVLDQWQKATPDRHATIDAIRGSVALGQDDEEGAVKAWTASLAADPKNVDTMDDLAELRRKRREWNEAAALETRRIRIEATPSALASLALCQAVLHDWKPAFASIRRANGIDATDNDVRAMLPRIERIEKALGEIEKRSRAIASAPANIAPLLSRAALFAALEWPELALEDADSALKLAPDSRVALLHKGHALFALGRIEEAADLGFNSSVKWPPAEATLREIAKLDAQLTTGAPTADAFAQRALLLDQLNQHLLALRDAEAALKLDGNCADALSAKGNALAGIGQPKEGLAALVRATELKPDGELAWFSRGEVEHSLGKFRAAIASLNRVLTMKSHAEARRLRDDSLHALGEDLNTNLKVPFQK
jgi:tetratricopeptide (TPR) repeat protein